MQPTLAATNERRSVFSDDHPMVQSIDKCIMDLIIVDMLPYSIVEGEAFQCLHFTDPAGLLRYKLKSEKFYRTTFYRTTFAENGGYRNIFSLAKLDHTWYT